MDNELLKLVYEALDDKKANDIRIIDIREVSSMCDYIVIADASNKNQIQAMCKNVEGYMSERGIELKNREGSPIGGWILLDYYDIIVHIFSTEQRDFYNLEHIWRDGNIISMGEM